MKVLRISITLLLLGFILSRADLVSILTTIGSSDFGLVFLALSVFTAYQLSYAYNWKRVLRPLAGEVPYRDVLRYHMAGLYYNLILPTSMGGDVAKIYYLSRKIDSRAVPIKSIALLRGTGLLTNLMILGVAFSLNGELPGLLKFGSKATRGIYLTAFALGALYTVARAASRTENPLARVVRKIDGYLGDFWVFLKEHRKEMLVVLAISLANQLAVIYENFLILLSIDVHMSFIDLMYIVPLTFFATLLPVTISGVGIREGAFVFFLSRYGYSVEDALAFSLIGYSLMLAMGLTGGVVNAVSSRK